ncbi:MAG: hypothetical protein F6K54_01480 [Okeania sp. SIO3B5]|uniref:hypothetical protein n=1 Tax=Okeania sp. SIO3B5 TaxID=2607811 RepID=UPI001400F320|nr:hypothetical protein [Okeania sp. SIO3B5]NEO51873.1 hypothetical protein [Okeania sp. SIO3B5]
MPIITIRLFQQTLPTYIQNIKTIFKISISHQLMIDDTNENDNQVGETTPISQLIFNRYSYNNIFIFDFSPDSSTGDSKQLFRIGLKTRFSKATSCHWT